jgi:hypothetical protein
VSVTNSLGFSGVTRSVAVLPCIESDPAPAPNTAFDIVFRGTRGDVAVLVIGIQPSFSIPLPPLLHGLAIDPGVLLILSGFAIPGADGVFRLGLPPTNYAGPLYLQAVFFSTNPGYAPGSFSNVVQL